MEHTNFFNAANHNMASFGQFGLRVLTSNATVGETFVAIQVIADAVITVKLKPYTTPAGDIIGDSTITALALTAGTIIYGRFFDLQVASGRVIAYKG